MKKVKASWIISVPNAAVFKVKKADKVVLGQVLFESVSETERLVSLQSQLKGFSVVDIQEINSKNNQKDLKQGDAIFESKGWFSRKIVCPENGKFSGIDEFLNLHLVTGTEKKQVLSPTEAVVGEITEEELKLEFAAVEYLGRGLDTAKGWVSKGFKKISSLSEINIDCKDRVLLVEKMSDTIRLKSEVVGVGGIVVLDENNQMEGARINFKTPSLAVLRDDFDELLKQTGDTDVRVLVNGNSGRLLLVV